MLISPRQDRDAGVLLFKQPALTAFAKSKIPSLLDSTPRTVLADLQANSVAGGFCFMGDAQSEEWRAVIGFEGLYDVSSLGRVRGPRRRGCGDDPKVPYKGKRGYLKVDLYRDGRRQMRYVHRLVLEAFVGPCPKGMQCCHWDDTPSNNRLENLRWDTRQANYNDRRRLGTAQSRDTAKNTKISTIDVPEIRALRLAGMSTKDIAQKYKVWPQTINSALRSVT